MRLGQGERTPRPAASKALIRGVALIVAGVVAGVGVLSQTEPFEPAAGEAATPTTTTTDDPDGARPAGDPDEPDEPDDAGAELRPPGDYSVVVANGSGVGGAAARFSEEVSAGGFQVATPTNAAPVEASILYFAPGFEREAAAVAALFDPRPAIEPMPLPPPVDDIGGASVAFVVGPELADAPRQGGAAADEAPAQPEEPVTEEPARPEEPVTEEEAAEEG